MLLELKSKIEAFIKDMSPVAFELLFVKDTNLIPKKLATTLNGRSLIWYNTLWGHNGRRT